MKGRLVACACVALAIPGCENGFAKNTVPVLSQNQLQSLTGILERIRQDVGYYEVQAALWRGDFKSIPQTPDPAFIVPAHVDPPDQTHPRGQQWPAQQVVAVCPTGNFDFDVTKVEVSLQALSGNTASGDVGLKIPFAGASIGPDINGNTAHTQTNTVVLDRVVPYNPAVLEKYFEGQDYQTLDAGHKNYITSQKVAKSNIPKSPVLPVTDALIALRQNLVQAAEKLPCFDEKVGEATGDSIKIDFQIQKTADPNIGFSFLIITAKADDKIQRNTGNIITVTFAPHVAP